MWACQLMHLWLIHCIGASPLPHLDLHPSGKFRFGFVLAFAVLEPTGVVAGVLGWECGRGLAPDEGVSATYLLTDPAPSGASPLPHLDLHRSEISIGQVDLVPLLLCFCSVFDLDLRRPVKPRWPNAGLNPWVTRQDAGLAVLGQGWPMTAAHGFKPAFGHTEPRRGAEWWGKSPFGYFWGSFPKVTRCKSGTLSGRYRSNGYVPIPTQHPGRPRGRHRGQAPSHI